MAGNTLDYLPFGAQYYRAPTPLVEDFRRDLQNIAKQRFNTIKIWLQWRWNNPAEGCYQFDDLRELLSLAKEFGLRVVINVICDVAPAWFCRKYPDSVMIRGDGRPLPYQTTSYRQIGGAPGPCYHHPEGRQVRRDFIEAAAKELSGYPALALWDLWNEPELTCGILREPSQENMVCYCEHSREAFLEWLKKRYGTIEGLNLAWGRNYQVWEEIELPRCAGTFNDMVGWRVFFAETLADELKMRADAVRKQDMLHPVMVHTVPAPYFNRINACSDEFLLAEPCDLFGNSLGSFPFSATTATTAAGEKAVLNAEIHALGGSTFYRPAIPNFDDLKRHILIPLGRGVKGFLFWQYRPERMGLESPAWGLTDLAGNETPWLRQAQQINDALQQDAQRMLSAAPLPARIAVLNSGEGEIFTWCMTGETKLYHESVLGLFQMLYEANYPVDLISEHQLTTDALSKYDCVIASFPYYLRRAQAEALREWVAGGGTLISEALFASYEAERNLHMTEIPGYDFTQVFGAVEKQVVTASSFQNAYGADWSLQNPDSAVEFQSASGIAKGYFIKETLACTTGEEIARFSDGTAATLNKYEKGRAILIGTLLGAFYAHTNDQSTRDFLLSLIAKHTCVEPVAKCAGHVDLLFEGGQAVYCIVQAPKEGGAFSLSSVHFQNKSALINRITKETIALSRGCATLHMQPSGIELFRLA